MKRSSKGRSQACKEESMCFNFFLPGIEKDS